MTPMLKLTDTQRATLTKASEHEAHLAPPPRLPKAAANSVLRSLINSGLLVETAAPHQHVGLGWRQDADGAWIALRITDAGLRAIGAGFLPHLDTAASEAPTNASTKLAKVAVPCAADDGRQEVEPAAGGRPVPSEDPQDDAAPNQNVAAPPEGRRPSVRHAAQRILRAWNDGVPQQADLAQAINCLRDAPGRSPGRPRRDPSEPRAPREGTKLMMVLGMLRRPEGATVAQIGEATGWGKDTVRGFFAALKKKGQPIHVVEKVRQVGPNQPGSRGSYTIYRIAAEARDA